MGRLRRPEGDNGRRALSPLGPSSPVAMLRACGQRGRRGALQTFQAGCCGRPRRTALPTLLALDLPGRRDGREVFPHGLDHSPSPDPETGTDSDSSIKQQPDGGRCLLQDGALLVNQPQGYQGTDGVTGREKEVVTQTSSALCTAGGGSPG